MSVSSIWGFSHAVAITVSDTVNFDGSVSTSGADVVPCDAIWVGVAGIVVAIMQTGKAVTFKAAIGLLPVRAIRVNSTTTTATDLVALYQV